VVPFKSRENCRCSELDSAENRRNPSVDGAFPRPAPQNPAPETPFPARVPAAPTRTGDPSEPRAGSVSVTKSGVPQGTRGRSQAVAWTTMHSCRDRSDDSCVLVARKPTDPAWVGPPSVGIEPTSGCGTSTQFWDPWSPTPGTWTRRVTRQHPVGPGPSRASLDQILQQASRAGPPLPLVASARCSLFFKEHVREMRKYFCSPGAKAESGRSPSPAIPKDRGRMEEGLRARLRRAVVTVAAIAAQARRRRESFIVLHLASSWGTSCTDPKIGSSARACPSYKLSKSSCLTLRHKRGDSLGAFWSGNRDHFARLDAEADRQHLRRRLRSFGVEARSGYHP
jgi:hypothetical protein